MRVHDSQAYKKMDVTRERISRILGLREILLSFQTGFSLVNAAVVFAILESISGLEPSLVITQPRYLKLVTVSSFCPFALIFDATGVVCLLLGRLDASQMMNTFIGLRAVCVCVCRRVKVNEIKSLLMQRNGACCIKMVFDVCLFLLRSLVC